VTWRIDWTDRALKDAEQLDRQVRARIVGTLDRLAETGHGDLIRLQGSGSQLRLRVGDWRVGFTADHAERVMRVDWVRHRGRAYRD